MLGSGIFVAVNEIVNYYVPSREVQVYVLVLLMYREAQNRPLRDMQLYGALGENRKTRQVELDRSSTPREP